MDKVITFEDSLGPNDIGLIICGDTGTLKGVWFPKDSDDKLVPENLVKLLIAVFGIDPNQEEETLH